MFSALLDLFKHKHKWETYKVNEHQNAIAQRCKCGMKRKLKTARIGSYVWVQSYGETSEEIEWGEQ